MKKPVVMSKQTSLVLGEPFSIEISGIESAQKIRVEAKTKDSAGRNWKSWATWQADAKGRVDIATMAPDEGCYHGVDPYGLVYGMELTDPSFPPYFLQDEMQKLTVSFCIILEDQVLQEVDITFELYKNHVTKIEVQEEFVGKLFIPRKVKGPLPAVLVLGGSSGGFNWSEQVANYLASHGYAALAVAYFDWNGSYSLPRQLANIPLESCLNAMDWLAKHPMVDSDKVGLIGYSKGAELALLLASKWEKSHLKALVTLAPSSHVFAGFSMGGGLDTSSWSFQGLPVPYLSYPNNATSLYDIHSGALKIASKETWEQARIPVEKINSPILIVAGEKDATWPAVEMIDTITKHISSKLIEKVILQEAGHTFTLPYLPIVTYEGDLQKGKIESARRRAWESVLEFLKHTL